LTRSSRHGERTFIHATPTVHDFGDYFRTHDAELISLSEAIDTKSSTAWKSKCPAAKRFADAIRGIKHPRKPAAPPAPGETPAALRQRGGQSYAELETNWRGLVNLASGLPGFAPTDVKIQASTLGGLLSSIKGMNGDISGLEAALSEAQMDRLKAYFKEEEGLEYQFFTIKTTVKGQYGTSSSQWAQVKGSRW